MDDYSFTILSFIHNGQIITVIYSCHHLQYTMLGYSLHGDAKELVSGGGDNDIGRLEHLPVLGLRRQVPPGGDVLRQLLLSLSEYGWNEEEKNNKPLLLEYLVHIGSVPQSVCLNGTGTIRSTLLLFRLQYLLSRLCHGYEWQSLPF